MNSRSPFLRVAMIASSLRRGGAEKQTVYMARALREAGVDVRFFYLGKGGPYTSVLRETGVPVTQIHFPNKPGIILTRLIAEMFRWRPQVVLVNQFGDLRFGAIAGRLCRALTLGGVRSDGHYELNAHGHFSQWLVRHTHGLIANSARAKRNLVSRGIAPENIAVLPNVIDLREFDARCGLSSGASLPANRPIMAAVGSLQSCKRFDRFLNALALARHSNPALAGVIAGADCGAEATLRKQAGRLGLTPPDLTFLGECAQVPALLARCSAFVLCSEYEGFPNVILEAMAARLPVITTPAGDAGLIVQHGKTGFVVAHDDPVGMAGLMATLSDSPALSAGLGNAGRSRVEAEFSWDTFSERLLATFYKFAEKQQKIAVRKLLEPAISGGTTGELTGATLIKRAAA